MDILESRIAIQSAKKADPLKQTNRSELVFIKGLFIILINGSLNYHILGFFSGHYEPKKQLKMEMTTIEK